MVYKTYTYAFISSKITLLKKFEFNIFNNLYFTIYFLFFAINKIYLVKKQSKNFYFFYIEIKLKKLEKRFYFSYFY